MTKRMQRSIIVQEKPRVFPHRTSRKSENSRKPTYAEIVRGSGRFTRRIFEGQTNTAWLHLEQQKTGIFFGINPRRQLPTNTRKTTTMSTNLAGGNLNASI